MDNKKKLTNAPRWWLLMNEPYYWLKGIDPSRHRRIFVPFVLIAAISLVPVVMFCGLVMWLLEPRK